MNKLSSRFFLQGIHLRGLPRILLGAWRSEVTSDWATTATATPAANRVPLAFLTDGPGSDLG